MAPYWFNPWRRDEGQETGHRRQGRAEIKKTVTLSSQSLCFRLWQGQSVLHFVFVTVCGIYSRRHVCLHLLKLSLLWNADGIIFFPFLKKRVTSSEAPFHYLSFCVLLCFFPSHAYTINFKLLFLPFSNIKLIHDIFLKMKMAQLQRKSRWGEWHEKSESACVECLTMSVIAQEIWWPFKPQLPTDRGKDWWSIQGDTLTVSEVRAHCPWLPQSARSSAQHWAPHLVPR